MHVHIREESTGGVIKDFNENKPVKIFNQICWFAYYLYTGTYREEHTVKLRSKQSIAILNGFPFSFRFFDTVFAMYMLLVFFVPQEINIVAPALLFL